MALPLPRLDDRTFEMLVREGRALIPRRAPGWTDHNVHDPGITLVELFSYLVEQDVYRLDRTPAEHTRAFLRLVGVEPRPPGVAETVLELRRRPGSGPTDVPVGQRVTDACGAAGFELDAPVSVADARLLALATIASGRLEDRTESNLRPGASWTPFGAVPAIGDALHLGFDAPLGTGGERISLHVWTGDHAGDAETRRRLVAEHTRARVEWERWCRPGAAPEVPDWRQHYGVRTVWEYRTARGWAELPGIEDETRALTLTGFVRFDVPPDHARGGAGASRWSDLWVVRCRVTSGAYECPPALARVGAHAAPARHAADVGEWERLGVSDGRAAQTFRAARAPVVAGSVVVRVVIDGTEDEPWRDSLHPDRVGPHDRIVLLEPELGRLTFGDGRSGRVPAAGAALFARYRVGGGPAGNVAAGTLVRAPGIDAVALQPFAAFGGAVAESLTEAKGRAIAWLAEPYRCVTVEDYEALAVATPGVPVARARAVADHLPELPCVRSSGAITVVAVPRCPGARPEASPAFLEAVRRWLEPRRTLTAELHVVGPRYRAVAVEARLHVQPGLDRGEIRSAALAALNAFFHPLEGGPDGTGWPVGRDVYRAEVLSVLSAVESVRYVDRFRMRGEGDATASCGNIAICPGDMAASGAHRIDVVVRRDGR
jgi:predicted phage baseplate assembly protein